MSKFGILACTASASRAWLFGPPFSIERHEGTSIAVSRPWHARVAVEGAVVMNASPARQPPPGGRRRRHTGVARV